MILDSIYSVEEGTPIHTPSGYSKIEELNVGDKIIGFCKKTGPIESTVILINHHGIQKVIELRRNGVIYLSCTFGYGLLACDERKYKRWGNNRELKFPQWKKIPVADLFGHLICNKYGSGINFIYGKKHFASTYSIVTDNPEHLYILKYGDIIASDNGGDE